MPIAIPTLRPQIFACLEQMILLQYHHYYYIEALLLMGAASISHYNVPAIQIRLTILIV